MVHATVVIHPNLGSTSRWQTLGRPGASSVVRGTYRLALGTQRWQARKIVGPLDTR